MQLYLTKKEYDEQLEVLLTELRKYESKRERIENKIENISDRIDQFCKEAIIVKEEKNYAK